MKKIEFLALLVFTLSICTDAVANHEPKPGKNRASGIAQGSVKQSINFFIVSKRKKGKLDLATRFNVLRTKIRSFFHREKFVSIIARDSRHMNNKMKFWLNKRNAGLGTVWFDSHGMYKKGYSLFYIGNDEVSFKTLQDSSLTKTFSDLAAYSTQQSKFIIGSCYGGATYNRSSVDYKDTTRMNGDSLMITLGQLFKNGQVYACESWVMSKPGLFWRRPATGGNPGRKLFQDICYEPAWKNIGIWNEYSVAENSIRKVNTISLDKHGNMVVRGRPYIDEKKAQREIDKKLFALQPNLYK